VRRDPFELVEIRSSNHESAHATAAVLLGFDVDVVTIDRHAMEDALGRTFYSTTGDRPADEAVVALCAVLVEPGHPKEADRDLTNAMARARAAGVPWRTVSQRAIDLVSSRGFRRGMSAIAHELFERRTIVGPAEVRAIVLAAAQTEPAVGGAASGVGRTLTAEGAPAALPKHPPSADRPFVTGGTSNQE